MLQMLVASLCVLRILSMKIRYFAHAPKVFILWVKLFPETILLIDARESQAAIDAHHASPARYFINLTLKNSTFISRSASGTILRLLGMS